MLFHRADITADAIPNVSNGVKISLHLTVDRSPGTLYMKKITFLSSSDILPNVTCNSLFVTLILWRRTFPCTSNSSSAFTTVCPYPGPRLPARGAKYQAGGLVDRLIHRWKRDLSLRFAGLITWPSPFTSLALWDGESEDIMRGLSLMTFSASPLYKLNGRFPPYWGPRDQAGGLFDRLIHR